MRAAFALSVLALLASCGGGGSNPLGNPPDVTNDGSGISGNKLSFDYFQKCVNPIVTNNADPDRNCANAGCHGPNGTGAAYRVRIAATLVTLPPAPAFVTPEEADTIRQTEDMYKNYISAAGQATLTAPPLSQLLTKPLNTVNHRGGQIFTGSNSIEARRIEFWISNPIPSGRDEFNPALNAILFDGAGGCLPLP